MCKCRGRRQGSWGDQGWVLPDRWYGRTVCEGVQDVCKTMLKWWMVESRMGRGPGSEHTGGRRSQKSERNQTFWWGWDSQPWMWVSEEEREAESGDPRAHVWDANFRGGILLRGDQAQSMAMRQGSWSWGRGWFLNEEAKEEGSRVLDPLKSPRMKALL